MKIKVSKSQWEDTGKKAGWMKTAQPAPQQPVQVAGSPQDGAPRANNQMAVIDNALKTVEMQSNTMPGNGQKIRVLIGQIRELAKSDPSMAQ